MTSERIPYLYIDPWAGVAGDMLLAGLLDMGIASGRDEAELEGVLAGAAETCGLAGVRIEVEKVMEKGIRARRVTIVDAETRMFRALADLEEVLDRADLPGDVTKRSLRALRRLAAAEAGIHGVGVEEVHFHELGAVDTLLDVVGFFLLLHDLGVEEVEHGPVPLGSGYVTCAHGTLGVPAPATLDLMKGRPVLAGPEKREVTTPTGALLVTEAASVWGALPAVTMVASGFGAGRASLVHGPNVVRMVGGRRLEAGHYGRSAACAGAAPAGVTAADVASQHEKFERIVVLETVVDDVTSEIVGYALGRLLAAGVLDAWVRPVTMKKSRPGMEFCVLVRPEDEERLTALMFEETGTLGVRRRITERRMLVREWVAVRVEGRPIAVKVGRLGGRVVSLAPEYEEAATVAGGLGRPLAWVMKLATAAALSIMADHDPTQTDKPLGDE